jgi:hypothetical protein
MKKEYLIIFLIFSLQAQQYDDDRVVGNAVLKFDRETMKKIENRTDVRLKEMVAAYYRPHNDWFYAEVTQLPDDNFHGLANFVKDGPFNRNFAINFKSNARKLLTKEELLESAQQKKSEPDSCSAQ